MEWLATKPFFKGWDQSNEESALTAAWRAANSQAIHYLIKEKRVSPRSDPWEDLKWSGEGESVVEVLHMMAELKLKMPRYPLDTAFQRRADLMVLLYLWEKGHQSYEVYQHLKASSNPHHKLLVKHIDFLSEKAKTAKEEAKKAKEEQAKMEKEEAGAGTD